MIAETFGQLDDVKRELQTGSTTATTDRPESVSTLDLQRLLEVTQDRTSEKNERPTSNPQLNSKMKRNMAQSFTYFDKEADDRAR
jgi:hypothetical protein